MGKIMVPQRLSKEFPDRFLARRKDLSEQLDMVYPLLNEQGDSGCRCSIHLFSVPEVEPFSEQLQVALIERTVAYFLRIIVGILLAERGGDRLSPLCPRLLRAARPP